MSVGLSMTSNAICYATTEDADVFNMTTPLLGLGGARSVASLLTKSDDVLRATHLGAGVLDTANSALGAGPAYIEGMTINHPD